MAQFSTRDCIRAVRRVAEELDKPPTVDEYRSSGISPSTHVIYRRVGSWDTALELADLDPADAEPDINEEDCYEAIRLLASRLEHEPTLVEYERSGMKPSIERIRRICGNWSDAKLGAGVVERRKPPDERSPGEIAEEEFERLTQAEPIR